MNLKWLRGALDRAYSPLHHSLCRAIIYGIKDAKIENGSLENSA